MAKTKTKTKADVEKELKEALSALKDLKSSEGSGSVDLSWLPEKSQKQSAYFIQRACDKHKCEPDRVIAAVIAWAALQSTQRHGIHRLMQSIELSLRCKI
jgi:hypothetical protein